MVRPMTLWAKARPIPRVFWKPFASQPRLLPGHELLILELLVMISSSDTSRASICSARRVALRVLILIEQRLCFADEAFDRVTRHSPLSPCDSALAFELIYGVLRHRETLDWRLDQVSHRPVHRLPLAVRYALRLGAYQLLYLSKIPASAAINESVNLVKGELGRDWTGFVNGVLRQLLRSPIPSWPSLEDDVCRALSIRYSCPSWLAERWIRNHGLDLAERLCRQTLQIPPITLRTNTLRLSRQALEARLSRDGYHPVSTAVSPVGLYLEKCGPLSQLSALQEGLCYVEDEAAQLVPLLLDVQPGHLVLDACAAPGGKTTHLAALMQNQGVIFALDHSQPRLKRLQDNCHRLGVRIVHPVQVDLLTVPSQKPWPEVLPRAFDRILIDVPCSGLGILRRHPEAKWFKGPDQLARHAENQLTILDHVGDLLRPGGVLVYSACSTEPEETTEVVARFCRRHPEYVRESAESWLPAAGHVLLSQDGDFWTGGNPFEMDGFFAARLRKKRSVL
ncbi:MAG: 16S rRNA (cytosine(967)-C(5))-methyltransferase RsmB [Nitrospirae bacterium]|nr:MAG: 16S rRNA (cytosine(967)-C(5))-methyltransferase RsmB [Nitrospirota bacterium]